LIQQPSPIRSLFSGRTGPAFAQRTWPGRPDTWLIVVAVLVNLSWRLVRYGLNFPIWGDEAMLAVNICDRDWIGLTGTLDYNQTAPLGFLWAESCMARMFGTSLYALRLLPLVCGILSTLLFVRLACAWLPRRSAALAIAVFCASYYPVRHATEIKPYAVDLFVCLCLTLLGLQLHRNRNRHRGWLAWVLLSVVAVWCSYPAVFVCGGVLLALLPGVIVERDSGRRCWWALSAGMLCISFATMSHMLFATQADHIAELASSEMWRGAFPPLDQPWTIPWWLLRIHAGRMLAYPLGGDDWGSLPTLILVTLGIAAAYRSRRRQDLPLFLAPAVCALFAACLHTYPYGGSARTSLFLAPAICLLAGSGLHSVCRRGSCGILVRKRVRALCLALMFLTCGGVVRDVVQPYKTMSDAQLRRAFIDLLRRSEPDEPWIVVNRLANHEPQQTVMPGGLTVPDFDFYTRTLGQSRLLPSRQLDDLAPEHPVVWLVTHVSTRHPVDPSHQARSFAALSSAYVRTEHVRWQLDAFESLQAWKFSLPRHDFHGDAVRRRMATSASAGASAVQGN